MPILFLVFVLSYMDRVNIGYAKLQFSETLGLTDATYGMGAGIFFMGYLVSGIPSNMLLAKIGARATISRIMVTWGIVSSLMMFISTPMQFYILRFSLGLAEGGLAPGVYLYLTYWFPENRRAKMVAIFLAAVPVAGVLCAPVSGYLLESMRNVGGLYGWQWMFLIEGIPSVIVGVFAYFLVENAPNTANWLAEDEKKVIAAALAADANNKNVSKRRINIKDALTSKTFIVLATIEIIGGVAIAGFAFWLPQIVHDLGVVNLGSNGVITAIPYLSASIGMVVWGYLSDRFKERRWHYAIAASLGAIGLFVACRNTGNVYLAMFGLTLAYTGIMSCVSVFWAYATTYLKSGAAVVGIGVLNAAASLAAYASQYAFGVVSMATKNSLSGLYGIAISLMVGALLVFLLPKNLENA
ncbi:MFS transporter [Burkholderia sp. L27(2015)]|uniref:MFS transporter n=1 Tax=Burkholderia sp. L27(2015) TaxID=1641858 RepID=UPI00131D2A77|nr:MFS transporter [Burkholderia sp. L27(2015)]